MNRLRPIFTLVALLTAPLAVGCVANDPPTHRLTTVIDTGEQASYRMPAYRAATASALVFDPPVTTTEPPIELARAPRQPGAFFGYDEGSIEYYRLYVDDQQVFGIQPGVRRGIGAYGYGAGGGWGWGGGWQDRYERRATSERVGAIRR
jgi:hypothetical protein